jgi:hypothetical protein
MSTTEEMVTDIALALSNHLYKEQKKILNSRYIDDTTNELLVVQGLPLVALSDILPFHPLFVSSVKLDYTIDNEKIKQADSARDIRISVEFKSDKPTRL